MFVCSDGCDLPDNPFNISSYYFIYYYLFIFSVGMFDLTAVLQSHTLFMMLQPRHFYFDWLLTDDWRTTSTLFIRIIKKKTLLTSYKLVTKVAITIK